MNGNKDKCAPAPKKTGPKSGDKPKSQKNQKSSPFPGKKNK